MGFSLVGLLIAVAVLAPNLILAFAPPVEGVRGLVSAGPFFTVLERGGQIGCLLLLCLTYFAEPDIGFWFMAVCIAAYWALWVRYLLRGRHIASLFEPVARIPIPMAVLPVLAFTFAAVWGESLWLALATIVLAIGHLANSWASYRALAHS